MAGPYWLCVTCIYSSSNPILGIHISLDQGIRLYDYPNFDTIAVVLLVHVFCHLYRGGQEATVNLSCVPLMAGRCLVCR